MTGHTALCCAPPSLAQPGVKLSEDVVLLLALILQLILTAMFPEC